MNLREFTDLQEEISSLQRQLDRELGARDKLKSDLFEKFDCSTIKEARTRLEDLDEQIAREEKKFARQLKEFQNEFVEQIPEDS